MARTKNPARRSRFSAHVAFAEQDSEAFLPTKAEMEMKKEAGEENGVSILHPRSKVSLLPTWTRFPAVLVFSLFLSSVMYSVSTQWTNGELAAVSRKYEGWSVLAGLLGWRGAELALAWFGDYDSYDLVSLVILAHYPPIHLLSTFYSVSLRTAVTSLLIDGLATYIPFRLLKPVSKAHKISIELQDAGPKSNEALVADRYVKAFTSILAGCIYGTTLYASYATFLPTTLVTYFNDIPSVAAAHDSKTILPMNMILGFAAHSFIFAPAAILPQKSVNFDTVTATLAETIWYNVWGWSDRTKMVLKRTAVLASVVGVNGWLQTWATIEGVEPTGAVVYSGIWVVGSLITGVSFALVADV